MNHRDKRASENNSGIYILNIKEENASTNNKIDKAGANKTNKILEVNFKNMKLIYPEEGNLLRNWQPALNTQYRTSRNTFSLKFCLNNLQVKPVDRHKRKWLKITQQMVKSTQKIKMMIKLGIPVDIDF